MVRQYRCECSDPNCPVCKGNCAKPKRLTLGRIDMEDETGTNMCQGCAEDALDSGIFRVLHWAKGRR